MKILLSTLILISTIFCNDADLSGSEAARSRTKKAQYDATDELGSSASKDTSRPEAPPNPNCKKSFNVFFLVDSSTSMNCEGSSSDVESISCYGGQNSKISLARALMKDIRSKFTESNASLISYDLDATSHLSGSSGESRFNSAVDAVEVYDGIQASSNLHAGLLKLQNEVRASSTKNIVFILSDGKSNINSYKVSSLASSIKSSDTTFHGIAVSGGGRVNMSELESLSSEVFSLDSRDDVSSISKSFSEEYCRQ